MIDPGPEHENSPTVEAASERDSTRQTVTLIFWYIVTIIASVIIPLGGFIPWALSFRLPRGESEPSRRLLFTIALFGSLLWAFAWLLVQGRSYP